MESLSDHEIINRVFGGNTRSFAELVERHKDKAMTIAMRMLRNREEAEEAVQDAFVRAFNALGRFEKRSTFSTWLYRILFNVCSTSLSKHGEPVQSISSGDNEEGHEDEIPDFSEIPDSIVEGEEFRTACYRGAERVPPLYGELPPCFTSTTYAMKKLLRLPDRR